MRGFMTYRASNRSTLADLSSRARDSVLARLTGHASKTGQSLESGGSSLSGGSALTLLPGHS